jgi:uncharacterized YkwD family protein
MKEVATMKRNTLVLVMILASLALTSCAQKSVKGTESSVSQMNEITRLKIIADNVSVRSGCSNNSNVIQTVNKDSKLDVIAKVADWYAVKLQDNDIGFVPQKQSTPVIPDEIKPGTAADSAPASPYTTPGTAQGTKQATPNAAQTNSSALTAQEQQMLTLVNQARAEANVPALQVDMQLTKMARVKSQDMINNNYFSHNSPKYGSPFDMMKSFGINYVHAGENIAGNQTVQAAHNALMNSPGHRKNILSTDYTHIGIGIQQGGQFGLMFTQDFISKPT